MNDHIVTGLRGHVTEVGIRGQDGRPSLTGPSTHLTEIRTISDSSKCFDDADDSD